MARALRIQFAGALYHVMSRGVARQVVFIDDHDYRERMRLIRETVEAHELRVHAFALMPNHDHAFLDTPRANLSRAMHDLNGRYAAYFNRRHKRVGHVFQGRFHAHVVESQGHFLEVSRYIHLNPVRAGLVVHPEDWSHSSCAGYLDPAARLGWITYTSVLESFGLSLQQAVPAYRAFVEQGLASPPSAPWNDAAAELVIGSERFIERVRRIVGSQPDDREVPQRRALRRRPCIDAVIAMVPTILPCDPASWRPRSRDRGLCRAFAAWVARRTYGHPSGEIASRLGYSGPSAVSQAVKYVEARLPQFREAIKAIEAALGPGPELH